MKHLITGGAGFIGSHLADHLLARGDAVCAFDNLSTGCRANVEHLLGHERFELVEGDVLDREALGPHVAACDRVIHLAAAVGVRLIMEQPVQTIVTNVQGTENVLEVASRSACPVLLASTSEVYGKNMETGDDVPHLSEEDDWTLGPTSRRRWAYACSKALDEFLALAYHEERGLPVVVMRFFNVVGPRQTGRYGMVIPTFVEQALAGEPIRVFGDGEQTRCFTSVADAVRAVAALLETPVAFGEVFNIGSNEEISINELARRVRAAAGSSSEIVHVPYEEVYGPGFEDMRRRSPNVRKLEETVGVRPEHTIDDVLREVIRSLEHEPVPVAVNGAVRSSSFRNGPVR